MEENGYKPTDFDSLTGSRQFQMLKAALPYLPLQHQKALSMYTKISELRKTISLFQDSDNQPLGACSLDSGSSPVEMLSAICPFGSPAEQEMIQTIAQVMQAAGTASGGVSAMEASDTGNKKPPKISLETIRPLLPSELQSKLETMQLLMQVMQA